MTDLVQFPVELGRFVVLSLRWLLAEEEDQPAVVDVQRVVVSVHVCGSRKGEVRVTNGRYFTRPSKSHMTEVRNISNYTIL